MSPEEILANLEATSAVADQLDHLKTGLEQRGWSTPAAEHASIVITQTLFHMSTPRGLF